MVLCVEEGLSSAASVIKFTSNCIRVFIPRKQDN